MATMRMSLAAVLVFAVLAFAAGRPAGATSADDICAPAANPCVVSTLINVTDASVLDFGQRALRIASGGRLSVGSGGMVIQAGAVTVEQGGSIGGRGSSSLPGGTVELRGTSLVMSGTLDVAGSPAGNLSLIFTNNVVMTGLVEAQALSSDSVGGKIFIEGGGVTIASAIRVFGGPQDGTGGDLEVVAAADLGFGGSVDAMATDGGSIAMRAGAGPMGGNLTLTAGAVLDASARNLGGFGGSIDLGAGGNRIANGHVRIGGSLLSRGAAGTLDLGGGSGGDISIAASGGVHIQSTATVNASGGTPDGDGGEIDIVSDGAIDGEGVTIEAPINVTGPNNAGGGGSVAIDSIGSVSVRASISASATDGGEVTIASAAGSVTVGPGATINTSGNGATGLGGAICLESATLEADVSPAIVLVNGNLFADGGSSPPSSAGSGGAIEIIGLDAARVTGIISADGGNGGGAGGGIEVTALIGTAFVDGTLRARGRNNTGGSVAVEGTRIEVARNAAVDVSGNGSTVTSTDIGLKATGGSVLVGGNLIATGSPGSGGFIEVKSDRAVAISGTVTADGGSQPGGRVRLEGCSVIVCGFGALPELCMGNTGTVRTQGPAGINRIVGRDEAAVFGSMLANAQSGRNEIAVRPPSSQNLVILGTVTPAANVQADASIEACPACGDGTIQEPETCDDGNTVSGDGCSEDCQLECDPVPGDVNGDCVVTPDDIRPMIAAIFSGRSAQQAPRADANQDGRISAADLVAMIQIIAED